MRALSFDEVRRCRTMQHGGRGRPLRQECRGGVQPDVPRALVPELSQARSDRARRGPLEGDHPRERSEPGEDGSRPRRQAGPPASVCWDRSPLGTRRDRRQGQGRLVAPVAPGVPSPPVPPADAVVPLLYFIATVGAVSEATIRRYSAAWKTSPCRGLPARGSPRRFTMPRGRT